MGFLSGSHNLNRHFVPLRLTLPSMSAIIVPVTAKQEFQTKSFCLKQIVYSFAAKWTNGKLDNNVQQMGSS